MKTFMFRASSAMILASAVSIGSMVGWSTSIAKEPAARTTNMASTPHLAVQTSINALMVALVDDSAQTIWDGAYAKTLTDSDWLKVGGNAVKLNGAGTLISLGGMGKDDLVWARAPAWQEWAQKLTDSAVLAQNAVKSKDRMALVAAGDAMVMACEGCHTAFKLELPTGGFYHIPTGNELNGRR